MGVGGCWLARSALALAFVLALAQTAGPGLASPLAIDEQVTYYLACGATPGRVFDRCLEQSATPPAYFWLAAASSRIGSRLPGDTLREWWLRFPAWCAYLAAISVTYRLAERWVGRGAGGVAAMLLAGHAPIVDAAVQARPYALGLLLNLWAGGLLLRLRQPHWHWRHLGGYIAANTALIWTHYVFAILLPVQLCLAMVASAPRATTAPCRPPLSVLGVLMALGGAALPCLWLAPGGLRIWERRDYLNWYSAPPSWDQPLALFEYVPLPGSWHWWWLAPALLTSGLALRVRRNRAQGDSQANPSAGPNGETGGGLTATVGASNGLPPSTGRLLVYWALWSLVPLYALWSAGRLLSPALAQGRYVWMQAGPAVLLLAAILWQAFGRRPAYALTAVMLFGNGTPARTWEYLRHPDRHDHFWLDAAQVLSRSAQAGDLVLVQSGLVENRLMPVLFRDPGFQEYTTSRLSDFYGRSPAERLTLPLPWIEGDWQAEYGKRIEQATRAGGRVWLVISADSDIGESTERGAVAWLESGGLMVRVVSPERVARILAAERPGTACVPFLPPAAITSHDETEGGRRVIVGVPKEIKTDEYRVAMLPVGVEELRRAGHQVLVEHNAGQGSGVSNDDYARHGAEIVAEARQIFGRADLVIKVKEPLPAEWPLLREGQTVFTYFHFAADEALTHAMLRAGITAVAYETLGDGAGWLPLLTPMSEVAGRMSIQEGAKYLEKPYLGRGILLGGVTGVHPATVAIIGGGVVGTNAAKVAAGLGANVYVLDVNLDRLRYIDDIMPANVTTVFSDRHTIAEAVAQADLVIGAVLIPGARAPRLVTGPLLKTMKPGSVIIDVAIDQGGCFETSRPTTHSSPTYVVDDVVHYCVTNMPGAVGRTSTYALCNVTLPYVLKLANQGAVRAAANDPVMARGVNLHRGRATHRAVADTFGLEYCELEG